MLADTELPVVVVGAGPCGMGLAACLVHAGIKTLVLDRDDHVSTEWRASTFHPPTLEQLAPVGLTEKMVEAGLVADRYQIRDRRLGLVAEFDYSTLSGDTDYPFRLQLEQYKFVELALDYIRAGGRAEVRYSTELIAIDQSGPNPVITVSGPSGTERIEAAFVVGADGAKSTTRKLLGIGFDGWTYQQRFLLISTDLDFGRHMPDLCHVNYIADPEEFVMLLRIPDVWRVLVPVREDADPEQVTSPENLRRVIEGVVGADAAGTELGILGHQLYNVHQRVAERLYDGRVVLVGDAAHINSPMGGFGLNSGLQDSFDLAVRLGRLLGDRPTDPEAVDTELSTYSDTRRAVALEHVRRMSHNNTQLLMRADEAERAADRARLAAIAADPEATRSYLLDASMINAAREHGFGRPVSGAAI
ncbi:FAD-dependent oxidoreductase [Prauserella oleivorans]|uniref:FAD-dependent oxidoreductase n=1 Tax=Prauserella oleivorans TaxID=1478153 RepID=A0ABW5WBN8_9PSEU